MANSLGPLSESLGSTSSSLLARVRAQDQDAWTRLVRLYGPLVSFWLRRARLQSADARDVFQDVFHSVARGIGQFHKSQPGDTFRGWLRTITRNKLNDLFRRQAVEPAGEGGSVALDRLKEIPGQAGRSTDAGEDEALRQLRLRAMELVQGEFEPKTWEIFWRVTVQGQSASDVAEDLGTTPSAVRMAKSRVLRRLREELGDMEQL